MKAKISKLRCTLLTVIDYTKTNLLLFLGGGSIKLTVSIGECIAEIILGAEDKRVSSIMVREPFYQHLTNSAVNLINCRFFYSFIT